MATPSIVEKLPETLKSDSPQPPLHDGKTRLYTAYICPYAQRVWITRNAKGLQDEIELVPLNLQDRPAWYKEKVNPTNKVPALEHNNKIIIESLDLIKYLDSEFKGPSLYPSDPDQKKAVDEFLSSVDNFTDIAFKAFKGEPGTKIDTPFDYLEAELSKFDDGPFFLGDKFTLADIAYIPFLERYQLYLENVRNYDFKAGRPKLTAWIEAMNKTEAYTQTKIDPSILLDIYTKKFA